MDNDRVTELAKRFEVSEGVVSSLYSEARGDLEKAAAEAAADAEGQAAQQRTDLLKAADEAMKAGDTGKSIALKRRAYGVQTG